MGGEGQGKTRGVYHGYSVSQRSGRPRVLMLSYQYRWSTLQYAPPSTDCSQPPDYGTTQYE